MEEKLSASCGDIDVLYEAKRMGFSDRYIAHLWQKTEKEVFELRKQSGM